MKILKYSLLLIISLVIISPMSYSSDSDIDGNSVNPSNNLKNKMKFELNGAALKDAESSVYQPAHIIKSEWDSIGRTYRLSKIPHKVYNLNTIDEHNSGKAAKIAKYGGDELISDIINIRKMQNPYLTFVY
ncbi:MAG: hypothetical protein QG635_473, partial [Bacteroidota bacterium]|nr:hypothetical protein [Bacteroidota bacterium]